MAADAKPNDAQNLVKRLRRSKPEPDESLTSEEVAADMPHLAKARAALAIEYLCPVKRCWARLNVAVAHTRSGNPKYRMAKTLALRAGIRPNALSRAMNPDEKTNGIIPRKLKVLAGLMDVDAVWLLQGFSEDGQDHWPEWTADGIAAGRGTLEAIFLDYLDGFITEKPTPPLILKIVLGSSPESPAPAAVDFPDHVGQGAALMGDVRRYIARHRISPDTYLARYIPALTQAWQDELADQLSSKPSKKLGPNKQVVLYGMHADMLPWVVRRRWIKQHVRRPVGKPDPR